jgi:hypothetical protein
MKSKKPIKKGKKPTKHIKPSKKKEEKEYEDD